MSHAGRVGHDIAAEVDADRAIARLATEQHGIVARRQLNLGHGAIDHRVACGRLHVVHRGVYAVGHRRLTLRSWWMAATLATDGVLSHRAAAALWGIRRSEAIEVTAPRNRIRKGVIVHRAQIPDDERTTRDGIPVTTVPRTLLDQAAILRRHEFERAFNDAEFARLTDVLSLGDLVARYPRRPGTRAARAVLAKRRALLRSDLEAAFLAFLDAHALPRPQTNVPIMGYECDCVWREARLIVELDTHGTHGSRFHEDRERDRRLAAAGWRTVRVTDRHFDDDLAEDLTRLGAANLAPA